MDLVGEVVKVRVEVLDAVLAVDGTLLGSNGREDEGSEEQQSTEGDHGGREGGVGKGEEGEKKEKERHMLLSRPRFYEHFQTPVFKLVASLRARIALIQSFTLGHRGRWPAVADPTPAQQRIITTEGLSFSTSLVRFSFASRSDVCSVDGATSVCAVL